MSKTSPQTIHTISTAKIFAGCTRRERARLDELATPVKVPAGYRLTIEGSARHELGVLLDGTARVTIGSETVATLQPGDHFGELSLLAEPGSPAARQSATVTADEEQWVAIMSVREVAAMLTEFPEPSAALRQVAQERLAENATD